MFKRLSAFFDEFRLAGTAPHRSDWDSTSHHEVNPTTGLPMVHGIGSVDVGGHTWCQSHHDSSFDDSHCSASYYDHNDPWS